MGVQIGSLYTRSESIEKVVALERRVARILAIVRSAVNYTVMVNRLPPEVLAKVLSFRHDDRDLISATHVCEQWRSTLLSTPLLWTEVVFGDPDRTFTYLERSKGTPLHVSIGGSTLDSLTGDMSWISRMSTLTITGAQGQIESIAGQLCSPAPLLQSLTFKAPLEPEVWRAVGHLIHIPPGFLGQQVPSLCNLAFLSVSPSPVTSIPLQHLTSLHWTDSSVLIGELLIVLASAPLLEAAILDFRGSSTPPVAESLTVVTLSKLRKLVWAVRGRFSLMHSLIAPELDDLNIRLNYDPLRSDPSIILPPHRGRFPLLVEPTALRYVCRSSARTWHFTYTSGQLTISESKDLFTPHPPADRWLSPTTPISFGRVEKLVVDGIGGYPLPANIPIEQFESLETLKLVGEVGRLLGILQPNDNATSGILLVPFLSHLELHPAPHELDLPFEMLTEILRKRKEAGHGVKTVRIVGEYGERLSGVGSELTKFVDVLMLDQLPDSVED